LLAASAAKKKPSQKGSGASSALQSTVFAGGS